MKMVFAMLMGISGVAGASPMEINYRCEHDIRVSVDVVGSGPIMLELSGVGAGLDGTYSRIRPDKPLGKGDFYKYDQHEVIVHFEATGSTPPAQLTLPAMAPILCDYGF